MRIRKIISCLLLFALAASMLSFASGCNESAEDVNTDFVKDSEDMFTDRDNRGQVSTEGAVEITLTGDSAICSDSSVTVQGSFVTLTKDGTYIIRGRLDDGRITVDTPDTAKPQLIFDGVDISCSGAAAIYVKSCDKLFINLAENSENRIAMTGESQSEDGRNIDGAIFSAQDLTVNGAGSLSVDSSVCGIVCKDDLALTGGVITVSSASHALDANDSIRIARAKLTLTAAAGDGLHSENGDDSTKGFVYIESGSIEAQADGDGISAGYYIQLEGGSISLGCEGTSSSRKGIKAEDSIVINGGNLSIISDDDAIHSNNSVVINGGTMALSTGDDGVHANETLRITDCEMNISSSYEGLEALNISVLGGEITLLATDDGINAAGGNDGSGTGGSFGAADGFGSPHRPGGMPGGMGGSSSSDGSITISGGVLNITAYGDGIDANGSFTMTGGSIYVTGPDYGDTATLDYDVSAVIEGGVFVGSGASGMAQTLSSSGQGVIAVRVGSQAAGAAVEIKDNSGNTVISFTPSLSFSVIIVSTPKLVKGESYTVIAGAASGNVTLE